ncbi:MAG: hypothetical protein RIG63_25750 [Coleofasciculus chthonoplastes F3-SA18-01]|uniref:hypothetical protein n=1 Tax=Coleofasciculus chthonoplastes TaxID=64178 RepID=UPI0032FD1DD9
MASITISDLNPSENFLYELTEDELAYVLGGNWFSRAVNNVSNFIESHPVLVSIVLAILL